MIPALIGLWRLERIQILTCVCMCASEINPSYLNAFIYLKISDLSHRIYWKISDLTHRIYLKKKTSAHAHPKEKKKVQITTVRIPDKEELGIKKGH